jgi:hypothetical protein
VTASSFVRQGKQFFFEKKNQKTFVHLGRAYQVRPKPKQIKVFWFFFFKKELLAFATPHEYARPTAVRAREFNARLPH